ncbi:MAG TPA: 16S rRNA (adenine(1518)-N(6)/adenine(1519)-N(6))-dimethyltransferase RsmA [Polyangiaceae bacterium]|nr:16S rRNA (adenine(1518)-N(6)/adenine(1519)-N(6))-dimethyltransferase RsmA [Polyangiaceae bacterium]
MIDGRGPKHALLARGLRPKGSFGQNFLADEGIASRIAELATTPPGGTVVEIGAGLGSLTAPLLARARRVIAIERDRDLVPALRDGFPEAVASGALEIVEADAKAVDYESLFERATGPRTLAGNLPYQITGPLLERTVGLASRVERVVYMVQLEVADRLAAKADTEHYGGLSVFVQAAFGVERAFVVRRGAFYPQPNVDSAVVVLTPHRPPIAEETATFRAVVRAAFAARRKTLRNAWKGLPGVDAASLARLAADAGIDLDARGETLDVTAFARMAAALEANRS